MDPLGSIKYRSRKLWRKIRSTYIKTAKGADHVGRRSFGKREFTNGFPTFRKTFSTGDDGLAGFKAELAARDVFGEKPWMTPILARGDDWIELPHFPDSSRLDRLAPTLSAKTRRECARQAIRALFDIFAEGYAHRDFKAANLFWHEDQLFIIDFETFVPYPTGGRPSFEESYDLTGHGLESPYRTANACFRKAGTSSPSLETLLGVSVAECLEDLKRELKDQLREASLTFQAKNRRHTCDAQRTYNSFTLKYLSIEPDVAQRRTHKRFEKFGILPADISSKTVLDIGSNIGGVLFELQKFGPQQCEGIEFDSNKVTIARRVAAFNGLNNVSFHNRNIDQTDVADIGKTFDVVFCLAVIEHVERRQHLYELLGKVTKGVLYFEGNYTTDPQEVIRCLQGVGFEKAEYLGFSDDDCLPRNNIRPIFKATKPLSS
jgi:SAM-dependent methyltransferase